ncbi:MAG: DUF58 domain-containing protein, partial [Actinomycetota bacterium]|nr:DUF58 domain-containing protein [Actinomycetota bacterium]
MTPGSAPLAGLRGLTSRGRAFLVAGLASVLAAVLFGQRDLLRLGVLLVALPLACAWVVVRARFRLSSTRSVDPARVAAGDEAQVTVRLDNLSRLPTGLLLVEDRVPYVLGTRPRFVLDRVEPRGSRLVPYVVRSELRGRFSLGPLSIRLADPFGMCELQRSFSGRDTLVVVPPVVPLPAVPLSAEWSGNGESRSRSLATTGEDDVATREYRTGDPLHRVHWRSTARYGELMVRREEQPWQSRATLLLDTRAAGHRGEGPGSSFEWAIAAAASIGLHLLGTGFTVRLVTDVGASMSSAAQDGDGVAGDFPGMLLDTLAVLQPSAGGTLAPARAVLRGGGEGMLVAVLGGLTAQDAQELARMRPAGAPAVGILLDLASWTGTGGRARE